MVAGQRLTYFMQRERHTLPSVIARNLSPALESIFMYCIRCEYNVQQGVVEECLKGRYRCTLCFEEGCKGTTRRVEDGQCLSII
jgi:hypothetical protein